MVGEVLGLGFMIGCWIFGHHLRLCVKEYGRIVERRIGKEEMYKKKRGKK